MLSFIGVKVFEVLFEVVDLDVVEVCVVVILVLGD